MAARFPARFLTTAPMLATPRFSACVVTTLALAAFMGGCATPPPPAYEAPTSGPTARLVMRSALAAGESYTVAWLKKGQDCQDPHLLGTATPQRAPATQLLSANRLQTLEVLFKRPDGATCRTVLSFTPKKGGAYVLASASQGNNCRSVLLDMADPDHLVPETTQVQRAKPRGECVGLAEAQAQRATAAGGSGLPPMNDESLKGLIGGGQ